MQRSAAHLLQPSVLVVYGSPLPSLVNVLIGGLVYLVAYLRLVPLFGAVRRTDLQPLAPILGRIKILRPATCLILAYQTHLLKVFERWARAMLPPTRN